MIILYVMKTKFKTAAAEPSYTMSFKKVFRHAKLIQNICFQNIVTNYFFIYKYLKEYFIKRIVLVFLYRFLSVLKQT